ncbi:MAG: Alanine racemase [Candidatus Magasanikbacteria bacterium GW2011_GWC2_41_17]|uniref:Alanine racemase n=2 Tax=Candidatus Magasanikiibacteriota TaxID=1752731 RepID=A0A0G1A664_9BACT|nr:MAG: Alanine racemase [Candidatus Magasanikbacteria bacterium GW2011_GWC2_41_17]KKS56577.1 MAG: Alanine racemase [Candidatus Magasanikbacteria bacterium GW2011_GWA2_42_32]
MLTWVEINKKALAFNLQQFHKKIGKGIEIIPVIKSNAYGHGFIEIARFCDTCKLINKIAVVNLAEALELRKNKIKKQIIVLSFFDFNELTGESASELKNISLPIYDIATAIKLNNFSKKSEFKIKIHLKIDTGASRIGFLPNELIKNIALLKKLNNLIIEGVFSHFASSEEDKKYTQKQKNIFDKTITKLKALGINPPMIHIACTAAALVTPQNQCNTVRLGIGFYGLYPSKKIKKIIKLKPVLSWHTRLIQVKDLSKNTLIGYGGTYKTRRKTLLGIIPVGYWDGLDRHLSNCGQVLFKGKKCGIIGRICMNLTMIDLAGLNAKTGDKITLIGRQGKHEITADDLAQKIDTINYEVVTRINPQIKRIVC